MKILVVGGHGTIGKKIVSHYSTENQVLVAGRSQGDVTFDMSESSEIADAFDKIGKVDAIVCAAGDAKWDHFESLSEQDYYIGIKSKLMGQVNLVRIGKEYVNPGGSITLSTGILADEPVPMTTSAAMVNGAIHSFVQALKLDLKKDLRVNVVSLGLVQDAYEKYKDYFPGHIPISMEKAVDAYANSIEGAMNGKVIRCYK